jgi:hypothetical protein
MQVKLQVAVLLVVFMLVASADAAAERAWTPGVAAGDYFYYDMYSVHFQSAKRHHSDSLV